MEYINFYDGTKVPVLGFGTYEIPRSQTKRAVLDAINSGYRLIDTAQDYYNEAEVGEAVRDSNVPRDQLFVTTKQDAGGYKHAKHDIDESLNKAGLDYFDLMIIHWPTGKDVETYQALEEAQKEGKLRYIGVSNFNIRQLTDLINQTNVKPVLNQIETHVYLQQNKQHKWLKEHGIIHEAWSPLDNGPRQIMNDPVLNEIAKNHGKTAVQVALRFLTQNQILTLPRSVNPSHIKDNINIFDFELNNNELSEIQNLNGIHEGSGWPLSMKEDN